MEKNSNNPYFTYLITDIIFFNSVYKFLFLNQSLCPYLLTFEVI